VGGAPRAAFTCIDTDPQIRKGGPCQVDVVGQCLVQWVWAGLMGLLAIAVFCAAAQQCVVGGGAWGSYAVNSATLGSREGDNNDGCVRASGRSPGSGAGGNVD